MSEQVVLNVHMQAAPGQAEVLAQQLQALVAPTRAEAGCVSYILHRDPEDASKFMFYECFQSQAALDAHVAAAHFQNFVKFREAQAVDPVASVVVTKWKSVG